MKKLIFGIVFIQFFLSFVAEPYMPFMMATHWNASGNIDGFMLKPFGLYVMPAISVALTALFLLIPKIDPLKKNIEKFKNVYYWFVVSFLVFMTLVHAWVLSYNYGLTKGDSRFMVSSNIVFPLLMGLLFIFLGIFLGKSRRNWFIGIRTPWTLSSDMVWEKTHKLGAKLYMASGVIAMTGVFFAEYAIWFLLVPIIASSLAAVVYSYVIFKH